MACEKCGEHSVCAWCMGSELCTRIDVMIAQNQRITDLLERQTGYENIPLSFRQTTPLVNTDYKSPVFEMGAIMTWGILATDATAADIQVYIYHPSIVTSGNKTPIAEFQGTGYFVLPPGNVTIPANAQLGFRFNVLTGGTYASMSIAYNRSEQTGIEWARSQRAGRIG